LKHFRVLLLLALIAGGPARAVEFAVVELELAGQDYRLEIADTQERRRQGLMFRDALPPGRGMLFVYPVSGDYRIWMKNTRIPLAVLWIDGEARIRHKALLRPCLRDPCPVEASPVPSRYILELPASAWSDFAVGQRLPALDAFIPPTDSGAATAPPAGSARSTATPSD